MVVGGPRLQRDAEGLGLSDILQGLALLALLGGVLLEHARPQLARDDLVLAVALPLALGWLDPILVPRHLEPPKVAVNTQLL